MGCTYGRRFILASPTLSPCQGIPCRWIGLRVFCTCTLSAPPVPCSTQGHSGGGSGNCHHFMVASKRLVSPGLAGPSWPASVATRSQWSSSRTGWGVPPQPPQTMPRSLETLARSLCRWGVLREAAATICAAHRPSPHHLYHAKWGSFSLWCAGRGKDSLHPSIGTLFSYLQHLRHRGLKHNTILSHVSALTSCTNKVDGVPMGKYPLVARWILGDRSLHPLHHSLVHLATT